MAHPASGEHAQSIGGDQQQPVDGIAGSHPGTQEPAGADVNAGGGPPPAAPADPATRRGITGSIGRGPNQTGVAQPGGATGALGPRARHTALLETNDEEFGPATVRRFNGSLARGGKTIGVQTGCGSLSRS